MNRATFKAWLKTRRGRRTAWVAAALVLYALAGFLLLPWVLGRVIPRQASDLLGREVTIERIRINPFALSGSFQGVRVMDTDQTPLLSWEEVYGNFQLSSIFRWAFTFREVRVVNPYVHLQINPDYTLNISDILQNLEAQSEETTLQEEESVPNVRVERMIISNAVARLSDLTLREPFHRTVGPVNLTLRQFYTHPDNENPYSVAGSTEAGERFEWSGRFFLFPLRSEGRLNVENVRIPAYAPFYQDFVSLDISEGVIDLSASYRMAYGGPQNVLAVSNATFHLAALKVRAGVDTTSTTLEVGDLKVLDVEADLWARNARVGSVAVNGGSLLVRRDKDGGINLVEMAQPSDTNAHPAGAVLYAMQAVTNLISTFLTTTNHAVAVLDHLEVSDWALQFEDDVNTRPVRLRLDEIRVEGRNLSNIPGEDLSLDVSCRWNTNGTVKVGVTAALFPVRSDVRVQIDRIGLPPLDPYVEPFARVLLLDSKFSMDGVARIRRQEMGAPFDVDFSGGLRLDDFSTVEERMGSGLLEWKSVQLDGIEANLEPLEVHVGRIAVENAMAQVVVETNRTLNVLNAMTIGDTHPPVTLTNLADRKALQRSEAALATAPAEAGARLRLPPIHIDSIVISNAALKVVDWSTQPPLRWTVTDVDGVIGSLSSTNLERAELTLTARAGGTAPVAVKGRLNPLNPAADTDLTIKLDNMDLLPFGPYSGRYAGYQLRKGSLSLDLRYNVAGRRLDSDNLIQADQLSLGQKVDSPEATSLPVKLGVAVLKDRNGLIELDVPIQGDLDDPQFRLGRVIGRTLMITLTKMLSSPFSLLGGIVGGTGEELSTFDFLPASATIPLSETNGLHKLARALYERPGLEVEIQGSVAPESDGLALKKRELTRRLKQLRWEELRESAQAETKPEDIVLSPDLRLAMLRKYYVQIFPEEARTSRPPPGLEDTFYERMTDKLLDQVEITENDFRELASERAQAVKAHLIGQGQVNPERLFLTDSESTPHEGSKVLLQLQ